MLQRSRITSARFFEKNSIAASLLVLGGLVVMLAYGIADVRESADLYVGLALAGAGLALFAIERGLHPSQSRQLAFGLQTLVLCGALLVLPSVPSWSLWLGVALIALLLVSPGLIRQPLTANMRLVSGAATVLAALLGAVTADTLEGAADTAVLGVGLLLVGQVIFLLGAREALDRRRLNLEMTVAAGEELEHDTLEISALSASELKDLAMRIHVTVDGLVRAAQAISEVTTQQTSSSDEQSDFIRNTNRKMDDFIALSEHITERARGINKTAEATKEVTEEGKDALQKALSNMDQIRMQVQAIGNNIVTLARLIRRIDEIINSVGEIATQSNLLALNASIEAARAGTHGRGFAVVADEVRSLAQQSTQAASQIREILAQIQNAVRQTIGATESGVQVADEGSKVMRMADDMMMQLASNVQMTHQAVHEIYDIIREQGVGLEEIAISVERIERITDQNLASTRMVATVSTNLNRLAEDLQQAVAMGQNGQPDSVLP